MDPDERARRREERRRKREEESDAAETNGPSEETAEEQERRERRERRARERAELSNQTEEDDDAERLRQEEETKRRRAEEEAARRRQEEEEREAEKQREEERRKKAAAEEKERKRNAEIERQRQEDLKKEEDAKQNAEPNDAPPAEKPKKKLNLLGKVSKGRKKEILAMMLKKARGDLQLEEQEAALERKKYIEENVKDSNVESLNKNQLLQLCEELHKQLQVAEGEKFDLEIKVKRRDLQISNLKVKANETRGRFAMPTLKAVSKTGSAKTKVTEKKDFRSDLKKAEHTAEN